MGARVRTRTNNSQHGRHLTTEAVPMQFMTGGDKIWACLSVCVLRSRNQDTPAITRETLSQALEFHHLPNSVDLFRQITS